MKESTSAAPPAGLVRQFRGCLLVFAEAGESAVDLPPRACTELPPTAMWIRSPRHGDSRVDEVAEGQSASTHTFYMECRTANRVMASGRLSVGRGGQQSQQATDLGGHY